MKTKRTYQEPNMNVVNIDPTAMIWKKLKL